MLRLRSLGQTLIEVDDARLTPAAETVFATALYLIVEAGRPIGRDELARLLWPDVSDARAQHGLRQALYKLKSLGATIKADRSALTLAPRFCIADFAPLLAPQPTMSLESLADRLGGGFLPGYHPQLSEEFSAWVERQRDIVHSAMTRALVAGIESKKGRSDWNGAEQLAKLCLTIDPLNEEATLTLAEAAALGGSKSKALAILNHYLKDIGADAGEIRLPAVVLRRRISEAYQDNVFPVRDAPFVGRDEEMAELTRALARAQSGHGSAYLIWGEPGIGKTRLVTEFTRVAALQRVHIARVGCQSHDVRRPLSAFVDLVPKLLALPGALGCSPESMQYLRRLTAHDKEEQQGHHEARSTDGIFEHLRAAVLDLGDAVASECCMIIHIEDSQWLDQYSRSVLESLSIWSNTHRLLLVTTFTGDSTTANVVRDELKHVSLHLRPLGHAASTQLVDKALSQRAALSQEFRGWCVRSGCGNPLFIIELATHATDDGSFTPPPSLSKLIDARLASLAPLSHRVLQATCVLGRHSQLATIERVLDERRIFLFESLDELEARGFIDHDGERITSRHALISAAALSRASAASRTLLHRHAASALEDAVTDNTTVLWDCAEHWRQAGDSAKAISVMSDCARHSLELGLPLEAASMFEGAAELATESQQAQLLRESAKAYSTAGVWHEAKRLAQRTLESLQHTPTSPHARAEAELLLLITSTKRDGYSRVVIDRLLALVRSAHEHVSHRLQAALAILIAADNLCDRELADHVYVSLLEMDVLGSPPNPHRDHCLLVYHCTYGDQHEVIPAAVRLLDHARRTDDLVARAMYLEHSGNAYRFADDVETAHSLFVEAFEFAQQNYLYHRAESAANSLFSLALTAGRLDEARTWYDQGVEQAARSKRGFPFEEALSNQAELYIREGRYDEARCLIAELRQYSEGLGSVRATARQLALEAHLKLRQPGRLNEKECHTLVALYPRIAHSCRQDYFVTQLVRGLASIGRRKEAIQILDRYLGHDRHFQDRVSADLVEIQLIDSRQWLAAD